MFHLPIKLLVSCYYFIQISISFSGDDFVDDNMNLKNCI